MRRTPALILGGGPAGSAAAILLARGGVAPHLIERSRGPRNVVCGAFLGWDSLAALKRLGLDLELLGARRIDRLRLLSPNAVAEARLPRLAAGLSRRMLDEALLREAAAAGTLVTRGMAVRAADETNLSAQLEDGSSIEAHALFLATGKHELRGLARPRGAAFKNPVVGLRAELKAAPALVQALGGFVELHLFEDGYAGLLLQEDDSVNLCISVAAERLKRAGGVDPLLAELASESPRLGERLAHAPAASGWEAIAGVPYGWRAETTSPGLFRLGDQAAVIASLAGDGVAIALTSGIEAASVYLSQGAGGAASFQSRFSKRAARPLLIAGLLRSAAENGRSRAMLLSLTRTAPGLAALAARLTRV
jgi:flavin-dependent dehydrogenase